MTSSNRECELLVVLDLVGAEDDWGVAILARAAAEGQFGASGKQSAEEEQSTQERADKPPRGKPPAIGPWTIGHQPSSRWSSIEAPKIRLTPVGVQAASVTGTLAESPRANMMSDKKYRRNPATTPPTIINVAPPRRCMRKLKVAATRTIAHNKNGRASSTLKCKRWRCAGKPDCSSNPMKPGRSQKDMVSGEAKLSSILRGVRVVARRSSAKG